MRARSIRIWSKVHTWTSLVCTLFLFVLCLTGLPLIFRGQIDAQPGDAIAVPSPPPGTPAASLDRVVAAAEAQDAADRFQVGATNLAHRCYVATYFRTSSCFCRPQRMVVASLDHRW